ncbi:Uncharacterised protein [Mycobacteroides abscessus subsp. abscessus]|nr:Uncharacterised protein [Mycobacteroides abscessus subsp. abscessus]
MIDAQVGRNFVFECVDMGAGGELAGWQYAVDGSTYRRQFGGVDQPRQRKEINRVGRASRDQHVGHIAQTRMGGQVS